MTAILVVEDDEILCQAMANLFKRQGYTVHAALSGNQAREILSLNENIEVVISDYYMTDGSGQTLVEHVKSLPIIRPFFILITGQADLSEKDIRSLGVDQVLLKPFAIRDLVTVVSRALGSGVHSPG